MATKNMRDFYRSCAGCTEELTGISTYMIFHPNGVTEMGFHEKSVLGPLYVDNQGNVSPDIERLQESALASK